MSSSNVSISIDQLRTTRDGQAPIPRTPPSVVRWCCAPRDCALPPAENCGALPQDGKQSAGRVPPAEGAAMSAIRAVTLLLLFATVACAYPMRDCPVIG